MQKTSRVISAWSMCPILIIAAEWLEILQLLLATILLGRSKILLLWQERQRSWRPFLQLYWKVLLATSVQLLVGTTARLLFTLSWGLAWRSQAGMFSLCMNHDVRVMPGGSGQPCSRVHPGSHGQVVVVLGSITVLFHHSKNQIREWTPHYSQQMWAAEPTKRWPFSQKCRLPLFAFGKTQTTVKWKENNLPHKEKTVPACATNKQLQDYS